MDVSSPRIYTREEIAALLSHLSAEERDEIDRLLSGQEYEHVRLSDLKIRTKDRRLVPFVPNSVQSAYLRQLISDYPGFNIRNGRPVMRGLREDILKARQQGISTLCLALYFLDTINNPYTQTIIVAHDLETTELLFQIVHRFWENLPPEKRRPKRYSTRREIVFEEIDSAIYVGTAGRRTVGRGGTINNLHMSERAFWEDGSEVETGLLESVPMDGNVTRETTANGLNDYYHERMRTEAGESGFRARFFGWNLHKEYRLPVNSTFIRTAEEEELARTYGLDDEQLAWRRMKRRDLRERFTQEYPLTSREAFLTSGTPYFNVDYLMRLLEESRKVEPVERHDSASGMLYGTLEIYEQPDEAGECRYVIGADVAEGIVGGHRDYSTADVFDVDTWHHVASYWSKCTPERFAEDLYAIGHYYNDARICVENNNHGGTTLNVLEERYAYPNLYYHIREDRVSGLSMNNRVLGYTTTSRSKRRADDALAAAINDAAESGDGILIRGVRALNELITYHHLDGGGAGALSGCHDDHVRSIALANWLLREADTRSPKRPPVVRPGYTLGGKRRTFVGRRS